LTAIIVLSTLSKKTSKRSTINSRPTVLRRIDNTMKASGLYAIGSAVPKLLSSTVWVAPNASVMGNVILHSDSSVWFGATIRGDNPEPITVGAKSNVQDGAVLHSDPGKPLTIGEGVTIGHKAILHGCTIGDNSLIGINACVLNNARIGKNCIIGAGCLIPEGKTIPDGSLVVGVPGKVVRELNEEQIDGLRQSADHYVENARRFARDLRPIEDGESKL
jgi:carbonic anhydrase/acetyltransferase-like protein (isoleucine patch superfamily)